MADVEASSFGTQTTGHGGFNRVYILRSANVWGIASIWENFGYVTPTTLGMSDDLYKM